MFNAWFTNDISTQASIVIPALPFPYFPPSKAPNATEKKIKLILRKSVGGRGIPVINRNNLGDTERDRIKLPKTSCVTTWWSTIPK